MRFIAKLFIGALLTVSASTALAYFFGCRSRSAKYIPDKVFSSKHIDRNDAVFLRLKEKARSIDAFARENNYNSTRCFLIDMHVASGLKRFFVYNFKKDSIEAAGLVTHGSGSDNGTPELSFSNTPNSNATSVGRYRVGKSYYGKFGLAYKLYGLDETNNKAFDRFVVLHSHSCVPTGEVSPSPICESWGCPTVAPAFLSVLKNYIDNSSRPILMWIYY